MSHEDGGDGEMISRRSMTVDELRRHIGYWLVESQTRRRHAGKLLRILRTADSHSEIFRVLPKDPRVLFGKSRASNAIYEDCAPGEMVYIGR